MRITVRDRTTALEYVDELLAYHRAAITSNLAARATSNNLQERSVLDNNTAAYQGVVERLELIRRVLAAGTRGRPATWATP